MYIANFNIQERGLRLPKPLKSEDLPSISKDIQQRANDARKQGEHACWWVENENGDMVKGGIYTDDGNSSF